MSDVGHHPMIKPLGVFSDANTVGAIADGYNSIISASSSRRLAIASVDWGCAVQTAAAATITTGGKYSHGCRGL